MSLDLHTFRSLKLESSHPAFWCNMTTLVPSNSDEDPRLVFETHTGIEQFWVDRQDLFHSHGYTLRPRYRPGWIPSWRLDPTLDIFDAEDHVTWPVSCKISLTSISDVIIDVSNQRSGCAETFGQQTRSYQTSSSKFRRSPYCDILFRTSPSRRSAKPLCSCPGRHRRSRRPHYIFLSYAFPP